METGFFGNFGKEILFIPVEVIPPSFQFFIDVPLIDRSIPHAAVIKRTKGQRAVIDQQAIEIAVKVIIKKAGLGTKTGMIQSVGFGTFRKTEILVVDIEFIQPVSVIDPSRITDVNIQPAIVIDIHHGHAGAPHTILPEPGFGSDILKFHPAFIQVYFIFPHITGKDHIGQAIIIDIAQSHPAAIIKIAKAETVIRFIIDDDIGEIYPGGGTVQQGKQARFTFRPVTTGKKQKKQGQRYDN